MADTVKSKPEDKGTDTQGVSDEALDSAYAEIMGEEKVEKKEVSEKTGVKPEPEPDQTEKSRLGRKVKKLEELQEQRHRELLEELRSLKEFRTVQNRQEAIADDEIPEIISTAADVDKVLNFREKKIIKAQQEYEGSYLTMVKGLGKENPELHQEIYDEMMANFNVKRTGKGESDAEINYYRAKSAVLSKKVASTKGKPNVKGERTPVSTNLNVDSRQTETGAEDIQLDDEAKEFIRKTGMKDESVKAALKGDIPIHLSGKR